ncbi:MAG: hypothetical protein KF736_11405 [Acidobacteria bacterium]|nr:hypothetical protein [Acidobacteriota bacterium]MCW5949990.1 hypothetical protein [Pyrinomonadaceae bacterium]
MSQFSSPLDNIEVASPCSADWEQMYGDERTRFCGQCEQYVYNLSGMTRSDAEQLLASTEGRMCVRYFRRNDGTVMTKDCPVGWAALRQRTRHYVGAFASLLLALLSGIMVFSMFARPESTIGELQVPLASPTPTPMPLMGAIAPIKEVAHQKPHADIPEPPTGPWRGTPATGRERFEIGKRRVMESTGDTE